MYVRMAGMTVITTDMRKRKEITPAANSDSEGGLILIVCRNGWEDVISRNGRLRISIAQATAYTTTPILFLCKSPMQHQTLNTVMRTKINPPNTCPLAKAITAETSVDGDDKIAPTATNVAQ